MSWREVTIASLVVAVICSTLALVLIVIAWSNLRQIRLDRQRWAQADREYRAARIAAAGLPSVEEQLRAAIKSGDDDLAEQILRFQNRHLS